MPKERILVVDDEPDIRDVLRLTLEAEGYQVYEAFDGQDALEKIPGIGPDLVIEAVGSERTIHEAFRLVRRGGHVVLYGLHGRPIQSFDTDGIVMNALTVVGHQSSPDLWPETVKLVETGRIDVARLVTGRYPLAEAPRALEAARNEAAGAIKIVLSMLGGDG